MTFRRFFAMLIDTFIIIFVTLYASKIFKLVIMPTIRGHEYEIMIKFIVLSMWIISIPCYFAYFESSKMHGTPGKYLLNIKIIFDDGGRINFIKAFLRFCIMLLINITIIGGIINLVFELFNKDAKSFYDAFSNTKVVKR